MLIHEKNRKLRIAQFYPRAPSDKRKEMRNGKMPKESENITRSTHLV